jgi:glutamate-1-semialdehyde 2,1-aminomutase
MTMRFDASNGLRSRFHELIPGGGHTYAKGDDQFPEGMSPYIVRGAGCRVWDVDGNEFIEYGSGLRAVGLGHAFAPVVEAARRQLELGANFVRPAKLELECAEAFCDMMPFAEMVKFCKDGSDATSGAVKLARAYTGRDLVAVCGNHPFFSVDDWFIGSSGMPGGIRATPRQDRRRGFGSREGDSARRRVFLRLARALRQARRGAHSRRDDHGFPLAQ